MISLVVFTLGVFAWNAVEYALHRFVNHGPRRRRPATLLGRLTPLGLAAELNTEHLAHHADPSYFAPTSHKVVAAFVVAGTLGSIGTLLIGARLGLLFALGFTISYAVYEIIHRRIHTHPPSNRYTRWVRRFHLHHHHRSPRHNYGVLLPLWDQVFGTQEAVERLRIPRQLAPRWLIDDSTGQVREFLRDDFEILEPKTAAASRFRK